MEHTHGECAGTACRVENFAGINGIQQLLFLGIAEAHYLVGLGLIEQVSQTRIICKGAFAAQVALQRFPDHVIDDFSRGVESSCCLAGGFLRLRVI